MKAYNFEKIKRRMESEPKVTRQRRVWRGFKRVFITEERYVGEVVLGWGMGIMPYWKWREARDSIILKTLGESQ